MAAAFLALAFGLLGIPRAAAADPDPAVVVTALGAVRGSIHDGVLEFKGIPYAAPPTGELRWALPQPVKRWNGTLDATKYRSICPQLKRYGIPESSDDEDCLYLNITEPYSAEPPARPHRVIVWIHGGAFVGGSSNIYPLAYMARAGSAVVVSFNYRLGVFGFMAHPAFDRAYDAGYGLEDQRAALRWVKRNIAAFGGDARDVTVAGESAGAGSACAHLLAPKESEGLFERAIVQSAACIFNFRTVAANDKVGEKIAALVGCSATPAALRCLRGKPVQALLEAGSKVAGGDLMTFAPTVGTRTLPAQGRQAIPAGNFVKVPIVNGGTRDELRLYVAYYIQGGGSVTKANYASLLEHLYGSHAEAVRKKYPLSAYSSAPTALGTALSDFNPQTGISDCLYLEAGRLMAKWVPVYEFVFGDRNAPPVTSDPSFEMGAVHSAELPYQFPHFDNTQKIGGPDLAPAAKELAATMMAYWTSFARSGVPAAPNAPPWPRFTSDHAVMRFEPGHVGLIDASAAHKCGFWKTLYPRILTQ